MTTAFNYLNPLSPDYQSSGWQCPACGNDNDQESDLCTSCGADEDGNFACQCGFTFSSASAAENCLDCFRDPGDKDPKE